MINVLSLFDGISCGLVALKRCGIEVESYFASEIDPNAIKISEKNHPEIKRLGDIRSIDCQKLPKIDLLMGGSPCQSFTFAGKRNGMSTKDNVEITTLDEYMDLRNNNADFEGESYLFWEYVRILKEVRPRFFLLENVKMEKRWQNVISEVLGVKPMLIDSGLVSAQNRKRLYWTNIPDVRQPEDKNILLRDIVIPEFDDRYPLSKKHLEGFLKSYKWKCRELNQKSNPILASYYKQPPHCPYIRSESSESGYRRLSPTECERLQTLPDGYTEGVSDSARYKAIGNGWTVDVIAHILKNINTDSF